MRCLLASLICFALTAGPGVAQVYDDLDNCGYDYGANGLRIYFDPTVTTGCQGIINNPGYYAWSTTAAVQAYLVLTHPTESTMTSWQCQFVIEGQGIVTDAFFFGDPAVNIGSGDTYVILFSVPQVLATTHHPLAVWTLALETGTNPQGLPFGLMAFTIRPAVDEPQDAPGYTTAEQTFVDCQSFTSWWHGWDSPCMYLNDGYGVTSTETTTWSDVKALFR